MQDSIPWYQQDEFWRTVEPILFSRQRMENAPVEVGLIEARLDIEPPAQVLDLCCGVGRHALEFARRGYKVTGVDRTAFYIDQAAEIAKKEILDAEFVHDDMLTFRRPDAFDVAINLFTSFGYYEDPTDDVRVAGNVFHSLKSGGMLIMDLMSKEVLASKFVARDWREVDDMIIMEERKITGNWSAVENRWIVLKGNERKELCLTLRLYSAVELSLLLTGCGFQDVGVYGDLEGNPYDDKAKRLVVVACK